MGFFLVARAAVDKMSTDNAITELLVITARAMLALQALY